VGFTCDGDPGWPASGLAQDPLRAERERWAKVIGDTATVAG
jgi:hypothetical protein